MQTFQEAYAQAVESLCASALTAKRSKRLVEQGEVHGFKMLQRQGLWPEVRRATA